MIGTIHKSATSKTLTINHQMGKIVLHSAPSRESSLRVRLMPDNTLETLGRLQGGAWSKQADVANEKFLKALQAHLVHAESQSYWYINKDIVAQVSKRFERSR
jgi:hypothetical protein